MADGGQDLTRTKRDLEAKASSLAKEGGFRPRFRAYWYRFRLFTDRHTVKLLFLWGATTVTILGVQQYQQGGKKAADKATEETGTPAEAVATTEHTIGPMVRGSSRPEDKSAGGVEDKTTDSAEQGLEKDFVIQSELEQKLHNWIVKLGLNKTTHDSHRPK